MGPATQDGVAGFVPRRDDGASASTSGSAPAAEAWQVAWAQAAPHLEPQCSAPRRDWPLQVLRSSQLDADRLDTELTTMLHEQFMKIFSYFKPGRVADFEPELAATLLALVFRLTIWEGKATPGSQLLNLRYRNDWQPTTAQVVGRSGVDGPPLSSIQRALFGVGYVLLPYVWARLHRRASTHDWGDSGSPVGAGVGGRIWRGMRLAESVHRGASLLNLLVFLAAGRYRSLLERVVGARLVYQQAHMTRVISFEYLNRQLVWQELSELLLFLLPLLSSTRLRSVLSSYLPNPALLLGGTGSAAATAATAAATAASDLRSSAESLPATPGPCPVCASTDSLVPFQALPCRHAFCYYCLRSSTEADEGFKCPLDGQRVAAMRRWPGRRVAAPRAGVKAAG